MKKQYIRLIQGITVLGCLTPVSIQAQIVPDATLPENAVVNLQDNTINIDGGTINGSNLFHSFQEFSVPSGIEASFNNVNTIDNILSRVTGGNISNIQGAIRANGTANLFLINPAGIVFGRDASLSIGGSFISSTADGVIFSDGFEYSVNNPQSPPLITINAPIGLSFRDNPQPITNSSFAGLTVQGDQTLALIGGDVLIEGGSLVTLGGRIEIGSVAGNNNVSLNQGEKGWDIGYEGVENFRDINLSSDATVTTQGINTNTGDIEVQGRNISLTEGSQIAIATLQGQAGNLTVIASESLELDRDEVGPVSILNLNLGNASGEGSKLTIQADKITLNNGAQILALNQSSFRGVDIKVNASEIIVEGAFDENNLSGIANQTITGGIGDAGDITIQTNTLTVNEGGRISTETISAGNAGDLIINATESIELSGTIPDSTSPSALFANVGDLTTATGNGGNLIITAPNLIVRDGAQIATSARNEGNGGDLTINAEESILLTGISPDAEFSRGSGIGRSSIAVNVQPALTNPDTGELIPTTGNGGNLNITTVNLTVEKGASVNVGTFSVGNSGNADIDTNKLTVREGGQISAGSLFGLEQLGTDRGTGGTLDITATESIEVTGSGDINGTLVNSSLFTLAQSNGNAGNIILNTNSLTVSEGGTIDASTTGSGNAESITMTTGNLTVSEGGTINASTTGSGNAGSVTISGTAIALTNGEITASTNAGNEGNVNINITENLTLRENSLISAEATNEADGGNVNIEAKFVIAYPSQGNGNDILTTAIGGAGGDIDIETEALLNIQERESITNNETNDIDASSDFGLDGDVSITNPDAKTLQTDINLPNNPLEVEQAVAQACRITDASRKASGLTIKGKGGIPQIPINPFNSDDILVDEPNIVPDLQAKHPDIEPIKTSIGDIYPARGVIKTTDGQIILTSYPTDNINNRTPHNSANCIPS